MLRHDEEPPPDPTRSREKFGVGPAQLGDVLALMGDSVDNVPASPASVPRRRPSSHRTRSRSLEEMLERARGVKGKRGEGDRWPRARRCGVSRELVRLRDDVGSPEERSRSSGGARPEGRLRRALPRARVLAPCRAADKPTGATSRAIAAARRAAGAARRREPAAPPVPPRPSRRLDARARHHGRAGELGPRSRGHRRHGALGVAVDSHDAPSALGAELVGLGLALPGGRAAYVPIGHRYLGAPACHPSRGARRARGRGWRRRQSRKHAHNARTHRRPAGTGDTSRCGRVASATP